MLALLLLAGSPAPLVAPASLAPLVERLASAYAHPPALSSVAYDPTTHLARWCYGACDRIGGGYTAVEREATPPAQAGSATVTDDAIGLSQAQLLASFGKDPNFAGKLVFRDASGAIAMVEKTDKDPPPARYDHGYQSTVTHYYVLRDGIVAAHGWSATEN